MHISIQSLKSALGVKETELFLSFEASNDLRLDSSAVNPVSQCGSVLFAVKPTLASENICRKG